MKTKKLTRAQRRHKRLNSTPDKRRVQLERRLSEIDNRTFYAQNATIIAERRRLAPIRQAMRHTPDVQNTLPIHLATRPKKREQQKISIANSNLAALGIIWS